MIPQETIEVYAGSTWQVGGVVSDALDATITDLTGASVAFRIELRDGAVIDAAGVVNDGPAGEWLVSIAIADQAAAFPGVHRYQVNVTAADQLPKTVNSGAFHILESII